MGYGNFTPTPPSTTSVCPLTYEDRSDARKRMAAAMSAGMATRRSGVLSSLRRLSSSGTRLEIRGVHTIPGATALVRTPDGPSSTARDRTHDISPALAAPYAACRGADVMPLTDATNTMAPPPDADIERPAAWANRKAWRSTMPKVQSQF